MSIYMITLIGLTLSFLGGFVTATLVYRKNAKLQKLANSGVDAVKSLKK